MRRPFWRSATGFANADYDIRGMAHITGGGLPGNLPRAVGADLGDSSCDSSSWQTRANLRARLRAAAAIDDTEMRATFNCGIGFAAVVEPAAADVALDVLRDHGIDAWMIGDVRPVDALGGARYVETR